MSHLTGKPPLRVQVVYRHLLVVRSAVLTNLLWAWAGSTSTRNVRDGAPEKLVALVKEAVALCIPLEHESWSSVLEESVGLLRSPLSKRKALDGESVSKACRESLKNNLLNKVKPAAQAGDRRKAVLKQCIQVGHSTNLSA